MEFDSLYPLNLKKTNYHNRKIVIPIYGKNLLFGAKGSGKSSLIFDTLKNLKRESFLYLNLNDFRIKRDTTYIKRFLEDNREIQLLILDNYGFDFELLEYPNIIITTNIYQKIDNFNFIELFPLDFEEYLSFDTKHQETIASFNNYLKDGTFPQVISMQQHEKMDALQLILKNLTNNSLEFDILKATITLSTNSISLFQIFNLVKRNTKISKDRFYEVIKSFINNRIIFLVNKYNEPNSNKKLYLIDFKFKSAISFKKELNKEFENMIFLKLLKRQKEFYYSDEIEFLLPKESLGVSTTLFLSIESFKNRVKQYKKALIKYNLKKLLIITVNFEDRIIEEEFEIKATPFWIWALED